MLKRGTLPGRRLRRLRRAARVRPCPAVGAPSSRWRRARSCARHSFRGGLRACVPAPPSVLRHRVCAVLVLAAAPPLLRPLANARDLRPGGTRRGALCACAPAPPSRLRRLQCRRARPCYTHAVRGALRACAPAPPSRLRRLQCRRARPCAAAAVCQVASLALTFVKKKTNRVNKWSAVVRRAVFFSYLRGVL